MKTCNSCGKKKPLTDYSPKQGRCKKCRATIAKKRYWLNPKGIHTDKRTFMGRVNRLIGNWKKHVLNLGGGFLPRKARQRARKVFGRLLKSHTYRDILIALLNYPEKFHWFSNKSIGFYHMVINECKVASDYLRPQSGPRHLGGDSLFAAVPAKKEIMKRGSREEREYREKWLLKRPTNQKSSGQETNFIDNGLSQWLTMPVLRLS